MKNINNSNVKDTSIEEWNKLYEKLFGGFEDLNNDDSYSDEEEIPEHFKTKEGYSKEDGFIVDSGDEDGDFVPEYESNDEIVDDELEDEETNNKAENAEDQEDSMPELEEYESEEESEDESEDGLNDIGSELSEESYISDSDEEQ